MLETIKVPKNFRFVGKVLQTIAAQQLNGF